MRKALELLFVPIATYQAVGYGRLGYQLQLALERLAERDKRLRLVTLESEWLKWDWRVYCGTPQAWMLGAQGGVARDTALYTMFEAYPIPAVWSTILERLGLVIVPSGWCAETFVRYGHVNEERVRVVSLGLVDGIKPLGIRPPEGGEPFVFLTWARSLFDRKGVTIALEAYNKVAKVLPNTELWIKVNGGTTWTELCYRGAGKVRLYADEYTDAEMEQLLNEANCFVYPSHGEGFGLMPLEAMARGIPVIATAWSGMVEFVNEGTAWPVQPDGVERATLYERIYGGEMYWAKVNAAKVAERMMEVATNYDEALKKAARAGAWARETFTWDKSAQVLMDILMEV